VREEEERGKGKGGEGVGEKWEGKDGFRGSIEALDCLGCKATAAAAAERLTDRYRWRDM